MFPCMKWVERKQQIPQTIHKILFELLKKYIYVRSHKLEIIFSQLNAESAYQTDDLFVPFSISE